MSADSAVAPTVAVDDEIFDYVLDKGPITNFSVGDNGLLESMCALCASSDCAAASPNRVSLVIT